MGEIAEMMLEGFMCEGCSEIIDGDEPGYTRRCAGCAQGETPVSPKLRPGLACPHPKCSRRLKRFADARNLHQHMTMAHKVTPEDFAATKVGQ